MARTSSGLTKTLIKLRMNSHLRKLRLEVSSITQERSKLKNIETERKELKSSLHSTLTWMRKVRNKVSLLTEVGFLMISRIKRCTMVLTTQMKLLDSYTEEMLRLNTQGQMIHLLLTIPELTHMISLWFLNLRIGKKLANSWSIKLMRMKRLDKYYHQSQLQENLQTGKLPQKDMKLTLIYGELWHLEVFLQTLFYGYISD